MPSHLCFDNDTLFRYHGWQVNLRVLDVNEIKTVPYVSISSPFVERLMGSIRGECLDHTLFWNAVDLERKRADFQSYFNQYCAPSLLHGEIPAEVSGESITRQADLACFRWETHCRERYQLPMAA